MKFMDDARYAINATVSEPKKTKILFTISSCLVWKPSESIRLIFSADKSQVFEIKRFIPVQPIKLSLEPLITPATRLLLYLYLCTRNSLLIIIAIVYYYYYYCYQKSETFPNRVKTRPLTMRRRRRRRKRQRGKEIQRRNGVFYFYFSQSFTVYG